MKAMLLIFATVFIAEIGDALPSAENSMVASCVLSPMQVFIASAGALVVAAAIGVAAGQVVEKFVSPQALKVVAGVGFVAIGAFTLYSAWKPVA